MTWEEARDLLHAPPARPAVAAVTLTYGRSPFGGERGSFDFQVPDQVAYVERWPRRVRAVFAGATVLDTQRAVMLHRSGQAPVLLFPPDDLDADALVNDSGPGQTIRVGARSAPHAVSRAPVVHGEAGARIAGLVCLQFEAMDRWFEEDDPVYAHLRDPYHRVDVRSSSRHVLVRHRGRTIAESARPKLLFETGLPVRYYLPFADVRIELLALSDTVSECPYKGDGQHWHLADGSGGRITDAAWSLPHPLAEAAAALEHVSFYPEKLEVLVDGRPAEA